MSKIPINLSSLAPESFIFTRKKNLLEQYAPEKVLTIPPVNQLDMLPSQYTSKGPWAVEVHPTSNCLLNCWHCSYGSRNTNKEHLSEQTVTELLAHLHASGSRSVIFSGGGDPLAWNAESFAGILQNASGYRKGIATNGLGLSDKFDQNSLSTVDIFQININGFNNESFRNTTKTHLFQQYTSNIDWLFNNYNPESTQITAKILLNSQNYKNILSYLEFCSFYDFNMMTVKLAGNFEPGQNVELTLENKIELHQMILDSPFVELYPSFLDGLTTKENIRELELPEKCWAVELGLYAVIRSNGDIYPCVVSPNDHENCIGNINKQSFHEIWESSQHKNIKKKLHTDMATGKCNLGICRYLRYAFIIERYFSENKPSKHTNSGAKRPVIL